MRSKTGNTVLNRLIHRAYGLQAQSSYLIFLKPNFNALSITWPNYKIHKKITKCINKLQNTLKNYKIHEKITKFLDQISKIIHN